MCGKHAFLVGATYTNDLSLWTALLAGFCTMKGNPSLYSVFRSHNNWPRAPTSRARRRDTELLRPSNLAARTLRSVEHTPSKFCRDPCPVRRGLVAAVKCCVQKHFFSSVGSVQKGPIATGGTLLAGVCTMKGKPVLFSVFQSHKVGL